MENEVKVLPLYKPFFDNITKESLMEFKKQYDEWIESRPKIQDHLKPYKEDEGKITFKCKALPITYDMIVDKTSRYETKTT